MATSVLYTSIAAIYLNIRVILCLRTAIAYRFARNTMQYDPHD